jgi:hypothetical protein
MKVNVRSLSMAVAVAFGIAWVVCSVIVFLFPLQSAVMTAYMLHVDPMDLDWQLSITSVLCGLVMWSVIPGAIAWLAAKTYSRLLPIRQREE